MKKQSLASKNGFDFPLLSKILFSFSSSPTLLKEYEKNREILNYLLQKEVFSCLSKDAITTCAKKLGILQGKTILFNREGEMDILMDYCLFHYYQGDKNAVDRYALTKSGGLSDEQKTILSAMQQAEYAFLIIEKTLPHGGVLAKNGFNGRQELLIDKGISSSALPKTGLISTIVRFPDFIMTTGAAIPINTVAKSFLPILEEYAEKYQDFSKMPKTSRSALVTNLLKICFLEDASENIKYS